MKITQALSILFLLLFTSQTFAAEPTKPGVEIAPLPESADLDVKSAAVRYLAELDLLVFEQKVSGKAGGTVPKARGALDGAPVLGYVFPTTLTSTDVGFSHADGSAVEGTVALAVTSHPDFDDTPLWDESLDRDYGNDGVVFHPHWVILVSDSRVPGGLAVRQFEDKNQVTLPPTNPGMPMFMDSPGFSVVLQDNTLKVLVPAARVSGRTDFRVDAVTAYMQVATTGDRPMLGVYKVYSLLSGDLSLPIQVQRQ